MKIICAESNPILSRMLFNEPLLDEIHLYNMKYFMRNGIHGYRMELTGMKLMQRNKLNDNHGEY